MHAGSMHARVLLVHLVSHDSCHAGSRDLAYWVLACTRGCMVHFGRMPWLWHAQHWFGFGSGSWFGPCCRHAAAGIWLGFVHASGLHTPSLSSLWFLASPSSLPWFWHALAVAWFWLWCGRACCSVVVPWGLSPCIGGVSPRCLPQACAPGRPGATAGARGLLSLPLLLGPGRCTSQSLARYSVVSILAACKPDAHSDSRFSLVPRSLATKSASRCQQQHFVPQPSRCSLAAWQL